MKGMTIVAAAVVLAGCGGNAAPAMPSIADIQQMSPMQVLDKLGLKVTDDKGMPPEQKKADYDACVGESYDQVAPPELKSGWGMAKTAGVGAAGGVLVGLITGDPLVGAAIGAGAGAAGSALLGKDGKVTDEAKAKFKKDASNAMGTCLQNKGYGIGM